VAFRYSPASLQKLELLFKEGGYIIRYEKGNFHSGYCVLEDRKVVVVNKYLETEARINSLIEILSMLAIDEENLSEESKVFYQQVKTVKSHS
jgi:hypothetical protein